MQIIKTASILLVAVFWSTYAIAETSNVDVTITSVDSKQSSITVSYDGKSRQLKLAPAALFEIDGKEGSLGSLLPGDMAVVTYDREKSLVTRITVQRDAMIPAEKLPEGWDQIDQRLLFLMVRLANVETSLDAIEQVIDGQSRRSTARSADAKRADRANEELDRKGGGPVKWSQFYGMTAEQFFYHPTDRNSTYHTVTVLNQQGSQADNKVGGGVPASQGLPVHQRPPQFDYIYKANERAKARAEADASELRGKMEQLSARRQRLEAEQAGLWVEIAFRAISHYDLDNKPIYRFEPLMMAFDTDSRKRTEAMKSASIFMAMALSIIKDAENNQAATFTRIKPMVAEARQVLSDTYLKLALDVSDRRSSIGRFAALAKRLEDVASNLTDSYVVAIEGDSAKDQQRKETFRATLQGSLLNYAQIVLAMDEMSSQLQYEYGYQPDTEKPIKLVGVQIDHNLSEHQELGVGGPYYASGGSDATDTKSEKDQIAQGKTKKQIQKRTRVQKTFLFLNEKNVKADWEMQIEDRFWCLENNRFKISVQNANPVSQLISKSFIDGDFYIEINGFQDGAMQTHFQLFNQKISLGDADGRFSVRLMRKGKEIAVVTNGRESIMQIKDAYANQPSSFSIIWTLQHPGGGTGYINNVLVNP